MFVGDPVALLIIVTEPEVAPSEDGEKATWNVRLLPALRLAGSAGRFDTPNGVPEDVTLLTMRVPVPVLVTVTV
jgi:hypothetical protein